MASGGFLTPGTAQWPLPGALPLTSPIIPRSAASALGHVDTAIRATTKEHPQRI